MVRKEKSSKCLDIRYPVLGKGYVELCDYLGDDESVVRSARQSYGKDEGPLDLALIDRQIKDMLTQGHSSPFEQMVFQFHLKMPIFVQRQFIRHRTARVNEISGRYTKFDEDNFYIPGDRVFEDRKSYGNSELDNKSYEKAKILKEDTMKSNASSYRTYANLIEDGVPFELARINLPLTLFTEFYWQIDLHNLLHFLKLRMDEHAQKEIRQYAIAIYLIVEEICPITIKYFTEYQLNAATFGQKEIEILTNVLASTSLYDLCINPSDGDDDRKNTEEVGILFKKIFKLNETYKKRREYLNREENGYSIMKFN
jgi:thymidylate synthase (FAD)